MRKLIFSFVILAVAVVACQDNTDEVNPNQEIAAIDMSDFYLFTDAVSEKAANDKNSDKCASMIVLNRQLNENPGLYQRMYDIEKFTRKAIAAKKPTGTPGGGPPDSNDPPPPSVYTESITIPVVVNILEDNDGDVTQYQIDTQIAILNQDFNNSNPNTSLTGKVPSEFYNSIANVDITFAVSSINRKISTKSTWGTNNSMKYSSQDGIDATDTSTYLNIWVCNIGGGILGYAQFPGGDEATDGIVIGSDYFGDNNAGGVYGDGRTATHEIGHWLNLRHIWGDGRCRQDDFVSDTPSSDRPNYGCPSYPTVHCKSNDMTMNYMDYVYDDCMYMFTEGQNDRMRALFASEGARESFVIP